MGHGDLHWIRIIVEIIHNHVFVFIRTYYTLRIKGISARNALIVVWIVVIAVTIFLSFK